MKSLKISKIIVFAFTLRLNSEAVALSCRKTLPKTGRFSENRCNPAALQSQFLTRDGNSRLFVKKHAEDLGHKKLDNQVRSHVELYDPRTNCQIFLLGCLHGSQSSAQDVLDLLHSPSANASNSSAVDAIVLELCATRFFDLKRSMEIQINNENNELSEYEIRPGWTYSSLLTRTIERKGLSSGIAATILGGFTAFQGALNGKSQKSKQGLDPLDRSGLEFQYAIQFVENQARMLTGNTPDLILADREVTETISRIGNLPAVSLKLLTGANAIQNIRQESDHLQNALWGPSIKDNQQNHAFLDVGNVLFRSSAAISDLVRLTVVPLAVAVGILTIFSHGFGNSPISVYWDISNSLTLNDIQRLSTSVAMEGLLDIVILSLSYITLALPVTKVILRERDTQLANGVIDACQLVARRNEQGMRKTGIIVAVLGLLHVNGVSKILLEHIGGENDEMNKK